MMVVNNATVVMVVSKRATWCGTYLMVMTKVIVMGDVVVVVVVWC